MGTFREWKERKEGKESPEEEAREHKNAPFGKVYKLLLQAAKECDKEYRAGHTDCAPIIRKALDHATETTLGRMERYEKMYGGDGDGDDDGDDD